MSRGGCYCGRRRSRSAGQPCSRSYCRDRCGRRGACGRSRSGNRIRHRCWGCCPAARATPRVLRRRRRAPEAAVVGRADPRATVAGPADRPVPAVGPGGHPPRGHPERAYRAGREPRHRAEGSRGAGSGVGGLARLGGPGRTPCRVRPSCVRCNREPCNWSCVVHHHHSRPSDAPAPGVVLFDPRPDPVGCRRASR